MNEEISKLDTIIRNLYADGKIPFDTYIESTELLVKLNNKLKPISNYERI